MKKIVIETGSEIGNGDLSTAALWAHFGVFRALSDSKLRHRHTLRDSKQKGWYQ